MSTAGSKAPDKSASKPVDIRPATGKLGILTPGMGAVATTYGQDALAMRTGPGTIAGDFESAP